MSHLQLGSLIINLIFTLVDTTACVKRFAREYTVTSHYLGPIIFA